MRNNFLVMVVLAFASLASAGYVWSVDSGNITVGTDTLIHGVDLSQVVTSGDLVFDASEVIIYETIEGDYVPFAIYNSGSDVRIISCHCVAYNFDGDIFSNLKYSGTQGTIDIVDQLVGGEVVGTIEIPEPATLLLMGLGGLLLRRCSL